MTDDTDRDGGPTPAEARRLLPELTAAVLTGEPLSAAIPRLQAGVAELALMRCCDAGGRPALPNAPSGAAAANAPAAGRATAFGGPVWVTPGS